MFFLPSTPETYSEEELPQHPMLELLANSEQILTTRYSRRLITMRKARPYDADAAALWREARKGFVMALERVPDIVWEARPPREGAEGAADGALADGQQHGYRRPAVHRGSCNPKYRGKHL